MRRVKAFEDYKPCVKMVWRRARGRRERSRPNSTVPKYLRYKLDQLDQSSQSQLATTFEGMIYTKVSYHINTKVDYFRKQTSQTTFESMIVPSKVASSMIVLSKVPSKVASQLSQLARQLRQYFRKYFRGQQLARLLSYFQVVASSQLASQSQLQSQL